jgi:hypothetical protein
MLVTSSSYGGDTRVTVCCLPDCDTVQSGSLLPTISTNMLPRFPGLNTDDIYSSETSVTIYQAIRCCKAPTPRFKMFEPSYLCGLFIVVVSICSTQRRWNMNTTMEHRWNKYLLKGKLKLWEKNLPQCHFLRIDILKKWKRRSVLFWDIMHRWLVVLYRRFGTASGSHLQALRGPRRRLFS